ncbi:enoyl-CoA hydratase/isomerase family protein [Mycolicibacterium sp. S2-37]|uniref:enoyl-CoA hydratase/isomerase family protein n=1 Tax=Mycolicibacterium sp. S2-37 TaxID=2810297 RepID=UPI001A942490|nr:enoyl-CoA hydratase-related protein [Mycolicibacterium sp. S2-37]MBO0676606.1 enoyl-CoA hydratase/isomerase family protein [Mycolicibacterium sp. S2-37]
MLDPAAYRTIAITVSDGIAVLTLNRPDRANAVDDVMHSELSTVFARAQDDTRVRAVVLTGAGRAFSTGGDESPDREYRTATGRTPIDEARHIVTDLIALKKPLIAAVNGHAIGLGAVLATLADISYVAERAKIGDMHVHAALPAGNGAAVIWPLLVGINRAKYLLMAGELITAAEAERFGLVTRALPAEDVLPTAMAMAARLAALAPQAVQGTKGAINQLLALSSHAVLPLSLALEGAAMESDEFRAAMEDLGRG